MHSHVSRRIGESGTGMQEADLVLEAQLRKRIVSFCSPPEIGVGNKKSSPPDGVLRFFPLSLRRRETLIRCFLVTIVCLVGWSWVACYLSWHLSDIGALQALSTCFPVGFSGLVGCIGCTGQARVQS